MRRAHAQKYMYYVAESPPPRRLFVKPLSLIGLDKEIKKEYIGFSDRLTAAHMIRIGRRGLESRGSDVVLRGVQRATDSKTVNQRRYHVLQLAWSKETTAHLYRDQPQYTNCIKKLSNDWQNW